MNGNIRERNRKITFLDFDNNNIDKNIKNKNNFNNNNKYNYNDNDDINKNHLNALSSNLILSTKKDESPNNSNLYKPMRRVNFLKTTKIPFGNDLKEKYKINYNLNNEISNSNMNFKNNNLKNNPILSLKFEPFSGRHSFKESYPVNFQLSLDDNDDYEFNENNKQFFKRNSFLKKTKEKRYFQEEIEEDPLQIPKEDEIFNELAKRKKTIRLTKIKFHMIEQKKKVIKKKKKINGKNFKEKLLNRIYEKNPVANKKMIKLKKSKEKINLNNYQNLLLKTAEPILSKDSFLHLDKIFNRLRTDNNETYEYNYPYIKDLENKEKDIIQNINEISNNYNKFLNKYKTLNEVYTYKNIQLPKINFRRIINKEKYKILNTDES